MRGKPFKKGHMPYISKKRVRGKAERVQVATNKVRTDIHTLVDRPIQPQVGSLLAKMGYNGPIGGG